MCDAAKRDFELACAAMLGALDALENAQGPVNPFVSRGQLTKLVRRLRDDVSFTYERVFATSVADDAQTDADLATLGVAPLRAEGFDHMPPFLGKPQ